MPTRRTSHKSKSSARRGASRSSIPFAFVLDLLSKAKPNTKPMFGCVAVYVDEKILFILRQKPTYPNDNGVWLATHREHHASLKKDLPSLRSIKLFGPSESEWQNIPVSSSKFEQHVTAACELFLVGDVRIGKIPKSKKRATPPAEKPKLLKKKSITWAELQNRS